MSDSGSVVPAQFGRFGLHEALMRGITSAGFETPWPIQIETIPPGLDGRDVLGLARTGTGKTAAFALPLLDRILSERRKGVRALILAPTRELATQITEDIRTLAKFTRLKLATIYGGVSMHSQRTALRHRPEIVVGCPGRVLDLLQQGVLHLGHVGDSGPVGAGAQTGRAAREVSTAGDHEWHSVCAAQWLCVAALTA